MSKSLLIIGASARAAAQSTRFAGLRPLAADLFADVDLCACGPVIRVRDYPRGLVHAAQQFDACPWMYTGALENHLDVLSQIAEERLLLGNSEAAVRNVRNPWSLARGLQHDRLLYPAIRCLGETLPHGDWLLKPFRSAGGQGIGAADAGGRSEGRVARQVHSRGGTHAKQSRGMTHYHQQRVLGDPIGAVFVGAGHEARLLGATRQLVGAPWTGATGFQYAGSIGPLPLDERIRRNLDRLGSCIAACFELVGLFGVDCIVNRQGVWTVEVNPRYTASVEVLERSLGVAAVSWHIAACRDASLPDVRHHDGALYWGKAVLYATARVRVSKALHELAIRSNRQSRWPLVADIPALDSEIDSARPIMTVFASGKSLNEIEHGLGCKAREVFGVLEEEGKLKSRESRVES